MEIGQVNQKDDYDIEDINFEPIDTIEDFDEVWNEAGIDYEYKLNKDMEIDEDITLGPKPQRAPEEEPAQPQVDPGVPEKEPPSKRPSRQPFTPPPHITPGEEPGPKAKWDKRDKMDRDTRYDKDNEKWSWEKDDDVEFE